MRGSKVKKLKSEIFPNPGRKFGGFYKAQKERKKKGELNANSNIKR